MTPEVSAFLTGLPIGLVIGVTAMLLLDRRRERKLQAEFQRRWEP